VGRKELPRDKEPGASAFPDGLKHNPFARLRPQGEVHAPDLAAEPLDETRRSKSTSDPKPAAAPKSTPPPKSKGQPLPSSDRIVVRRERKGHGGKAVTIAEGAGLARHDVEQLARDAAKALGVGARVEDGALVVQGEQTERLITWLAARGFASVVRGN
jgi:translation initiation factor 1 (eIF-1/SUI1)